MKFKVTFKKRRNQVKINRYQEVMVPLGKALQCTILLVVRYQT